MFAVGIQEQHAAGILIVEPALHVCKAQVDGVLDVFEAPAGDLLPFRRHAVRRVLQVELPFQKLKRVRMFPEYSLNVP